MNVLFIGDVFGSPGREFLQEHLPSLKDKYDSDFVVVNCENAAGGNGLTEQVAAELFSCGVDVLTSGNHIWDKKEVFSFLDTDRRVLRPLNYPPGVPGKGVGVFSARNGQTIGVMSVCGRVFSPANLDCPFRAVDSELARLKMTTPTVLVDFHAEATSEKVAMGWHLDGKVSAVFGTHTHVQTADETILPGGTAYITDAGMTGSVEGVIGVNKDIILRHFLTQLPVRHEPAKGKRQLCGVFCSIDPRGAARFVERVQIRE
jgi:metallophosphoesterase (TIGR00282 family)